MIKLFPIFHFDDDTIPGWKMKDFAKYWNPRRRSPIYWLIPYIMEYKGAKRYKPEAKAGAAKGFRPIDEQIYQAKE
jgi:hypothetical protein